MLFTVSDAGGDVTTGVGGVVNGLPVTGFILVLDVELVGEVTTGVVGVVKGLPVTGLTLAVVELVGEVTVGCLAGVSVNADPDPGVVLAVLLACTSVDCVLVTRPKLAFRPGVEIVSVV